MKLRAPRTSSVVTSSRLTACALALVAMTLVSGCTGSSSGGGPAGPTTPTVNPTPVNTGTVAPPKHVIVYKNVTAGQAKKLEPIVARAPGVQSVGYVASSRQLSIYLKRTFTKKQRRTIKAIVRQTLPTDHAAGRPKKNH